MALLRLCKLDVRYLLGNRMKINESITFKLLVPNTMY